MDNFGQYGPVSGEVLTQQQTHRSHHLQNGAIDVNDRLKTRKASGIFWSVLHRLDPEGRAGNGRINHSQRLHWRVVQRLDAMGFYGVYRCGSRKVNHSLITALVERWRPETHTFHFRSGEATVTLQDVSLFWALPIDGHAVISSQIIRSPRHWVELCQRLLGWAPSGSEISGSRISMAALGLNLQARILTEHTPAAEVDQYARGVALLLLASVMCPTSSGALGSLKYLYQLEDIETCKGYSWGSAVLAFMYNQLCTASTSTCSNIGGAMQLLQLWAWTRIKFVMPTLINERVETDQYTCPDGQILPIPPYAVEFLRFHDLRKVLSHSLTTLREAFDRQTSEEFIWQPYNPLPLTINRYLQSGIIRVSTTWLSKCPLIHYNIVELYHPDRVLRQFGRRQSIPRPVPHDHQPLHSYAGQGRSEAINWVETHAPKLADWANRHDHVLDAPMIFYGESVVDVGYPQWYERITRRLITPRVNVSAGYHPMPYADPEAAVLTIQRYNQLMTNPNIAESVRGLGGEIYANFSQMLQSGQNQYSSFTQEQWYNSYNNPRPTFNSSLIPLDLFGSASNYVDPSLHSNPSVSRHSLDINVEPEEDDVVNIVPNAPRRNKRPR